EKRIRTRLKAKGPNPSGAAAAPHPIFLSIGNFTRCRKVSVPPALALGRLGLLLAPHARLVVVLPLSHLHHDAGPAAVALEAAEGPVQRFVLANPDLGHALSLPPVGSAGGVRLPGRRRLPTRACTPS